MSAPRAIVTFEKFRANLSFSLSIISLESFFIFIALFFPSRVGPSGRRLQLLKRSPDGEEKELCKSEGNASAGDLQKTEVNRASCPPPAGNYYLRE